MPDPSDVRATPQPEMPEPSGAHPAPTKLDLVLAAVSSKNPLLAIVGLLIVYPGIVTAYLDQYIDAAIEAHDADPKAHAVAHEPQEELLDEMSKTLLVIETLAEERAKKEKQP